MLHLYILVSPITGCTHKKSVTDGYAAHLARLGWDVTRCR